MTTVTYHIYLEEPAIFSTLEGDPNTAISHPYIPGSAIRGMVISRFINFQKRRIADFKLDAGGSDKDLFFTAQTRYLNAYPLISGIRSLPVPSTWSSPKYKTEAEERDDEPVFITDSAFPSDPDDPNLNRKPKNRSGFTVVHEGIATTYKPEMVSNVHNARARTSATEQQVFRYEALAKGQTFMGAILCASDKDAQFLVRLLTEKPYIVMGGSRTAGYGSAEILNVKIEPNWEEVRYVTSNETILTFLSDTLIRDAVGVYSAAPLALQRQLVGMGLSLDCILKPISLKTVWIGGFNRKWGLPLPQAIAIASGSVVSLTGLTSDDSVVQRLITDGIGERREDGFGRVALGWQRHAFLTYSRYEPASNLEVGEMSEESKSLFTGMLQRVRDRQIEDQVSGVLYDKRYTIYGSISRTQLSRLRSVIANELRNSSPERHIIVKFLDEISGKAAGRQFDHARIDNQSLSAWLKNVTFEGLPKSITSKDHYVLKLVDIVLERAYLDRDKQARQEVK